MSAFSVETGYVCEPSPRGERAAAGVVRARPPAACGVSAKLVPVNDTVFSPVLPHHVVFVELGPDTEPEPLHAEEETLLHPRAIADRRRGFRLGRMAARKALRALGIVPVPVLRGANREPLWPGGVVGSITHAAGHAMAAVARSGNSGGIGIDLEHRSRYFPGLMDHIAFGEERTRLAGLPDQERATAAMELFSAKESIYKAFFPRVQRFFGFAAADVRVGADPDRLEGRLLEPLDAAYPPGRWFPIAVQWRGDLVLTTIVLPPDDDRGRS